MIFSLNISDTNQVEVFKAMNAAQSEIRGALKDSFNPHHKSKYADLASVLDACKPALLKAGFSIMQCPSTKGGNIEVTTVLGHVSGGWLASSLELPMDKATAQGAGSAITYARRYSLAAMAGVAPDDDDGNAASGIGVRGTAQTAPQSTKGATTPQSTPSTTKPPHEHVSTSKHAAVLKAFAEKGVTQQALEAEFEKRLEEWTDREFEDARTWLKKLRSSGDAETLSKLNKAFNVNQ